MQEIARTERTKLFDLGNGQKTVRAYTAPIHFKQTYAEDEAWEDIDLNSRIDEGDTWFYNKLPAKVHIKKDATGYTVEDRKTGQRIIAELLSDKTGLILEPGISSRHIALWQESDSDRTIQWKITEQGEGKLTFKEQPAATQKNEIFPEGEPIFKEARISRPRKGQMIWEVDAKKGERIDPLVEYDVAAGGDDGNYGAFFANNSTFLYVGSLKGSNLHMFMRFAAVAVPQGATIDNAFFEMQGTNFGFNISAIESDIFANDEDDAAAPTDNATAAAKSLTTASVAWDSITLPGTTYTTVTSPEIKTVIQEVTDRAGWVSGNDLMIIWKYDAVNNNWLREYASYENTIAVQPHLEITYTSGGSTPIKKVGPVIWANVKKIGPVVKASAKKILGISST